MSDKKEKYGLKIKNFKSGALYGCNLPESVKKELAVKFGSFIFDEYYK